MFTFLSQDWATVKNGGSSLAVTQSESRWLDLAGFQDVVTFLEVKEFSTASGSLFIAYQTAPTKDDGFFQNMNDTTVAITAGVRTNVLLKDTALVPLSHWFRWQLFPTGGVTTWEITFRLWVAANRPGSSRAGRTPSAGECRCGGKG